MRTLIKGRGLINHGSTLSRLQHKGFCVLRHRSVWAELVGRLDETPPHACMVL